MEIPEVFNRYRAEIDQELRAVLAGFSLPMYDMLKYQLGWIDEQGIPLSRFSGKALRPTLCLLASESITMDTSAGAYQNALPAAAAIELVHNFSLIHDDIQDDDRERRNRPSVWALWGKPQAINAGTAMRVLASLSMLRLLDQERWAHCVPAEKLLQAQRLLDESCLQLIEGQYLDISFESRVDVHSAEYLKMIAGKTAALISCSFELGAMLATEDSAIIQAFRTCGYNLGLAFQIRDDFLGIWGDSHKMGKPVGSDILRKKKSFPIVCAWERAEGQARAEFVDIYQREVVDDASRDIVMNILDDLHAKEQTQALVDQYSDRARAEIGSMSISSWGRDHFDEMICFLAKREY